MPLQVYSTLTRKKEPFSKQPGDAVTMYVCGPTVYKPSHIGHMVGPVIFDSVKRYLTHLGYKVTWVVNITDVDDKLIVRAKELNTTVPALAAKMTADYFDCLKKLNVTGIDKFPQATEHIDGMKAMIAKLIEKGFAYPAAGDVYFDVSRDEDYGKLCNRDPEQLKEGARVEVSDKKRNPGDFALWKGAKPGEPKEVIWDSPWGAGRPGWHIECSVMSQALLGDTIDIHGGGLDLQFPHHENELAQSESASGKTFARLWMHNGLLKMGTAKMAGSVGNVVNIADLLQRHSAETVRFLLLSTHYRSPIEYSEERLNEIAKSLQAFYRFFERYERITGGSFYALPSQQVENVAPPIRGEVPALRNRFIEAMNDDFNTGAAVGVLFELLSALNKMADTYKLDTEKAQPALDSFSSGVQVLRGLSSILGLFWAAPEQANLGGDDALVAGLMQLLIDLRANLRAEAKKIVTKDDPTKKALFEQTDVIRKRLGELRVVLEDRPGGTTWRKQ
ncbi:MAG TPA: cysteine--tRNA ligase [Gemmataceae bacterium]|nr:cysteine--tRNA ligase [Gemmataceae bacterium]